MIYRQNKNESYFNDSMTQICRILVNFRGFVVFLLVALGVFQVRRQQKSSGKIHDRSRWRFEFRRATTANNWIRSTTWCLYRLNMLIKQFYMTNSMPTIQVCSMLFPNFWKCRKFWQVVAWGVALTKTAPSSSSLLHQQASYNGTLWWDDESGYTFLFIYYMLQGGAPYLANYKLVLK